MDRLTEISRKKINRTSLVLTRYLLNEIDWGQRLIGIKGARGVGKTTLLLQKAKALPQDETFYASLDDVYFSHNNLTNFIEHFVNHGGKYLFLDEVHKYPNWSQELKNNYDNHPELNIVFTSSSALKIQEGKYDLSRRALIYHLPGLSFREFLLFKYNINLPVISLEEIIKNGEQLSLDFTQQFKPLKYFSEYNETGYYPYFLEDEDNYHTRLKETVNLVIEVDLPMIFNLEYSSIIKIKKLVYVLSSILPFTPNIEKLARQIGTTRDTVLKYLSYLHFAHIFTWLTKDAWGINFMNKPDKLFIENNNIAYAFSTSVNIGTLREVFFLNQVHNSHKVTYPQKGDFKVDDKYLFEVGGKNKKQKQIANEENAYLAVDNYELAIGNKIPLWMFGFLY